MNSSSQCLFATGVPCRGNADYFEIWLLGSRAGALTSTQYRQILLIIEYETRRFAPPTSPDGTIWHGRIGIRRRAFLGTSPALRRRARKGCLNPPASSGTHFVRSALIWGTQSAPSLSNGRVSQGDRAERRANCRRRNSTCSLQGSASPSAFSAYSAVYFGFHATARSCLRVTLPARPVDPQSPPNRHRPVQIQRADVYFERYRRSNWRKYYLTRRAGTQREVRIVRFVATYRKRDRLNEYGR